MTGAKPKILVLSMWLPERGEPGLRTGLLIEPASVPQLVAALRRMLGDEALRARLAQNGARLVRENYTWERNARANLELFGDVLGSPGKR